MAHTIEVPGYPVTADALMVEVSGLRWLIPQTGEASSITPPSAVPFTVRLTSLYTASEPDVNGITMCRVGRVDVRVVDAQGRATWVPLGMRLMERLDDARYTHVRRAALAAAEGDAPARLLHSTTFVRDGRSQTVTLTNALAAPPVRVEHDGERVTATTADGDLEEFDTITTFARVYDIDLGTLAPEAAGALAWVFDVPWVPTHVVTIRRAGEVRRFVVQCQRADEEMDGPRRAYTLAEFLAPPLNPCTNVRALWRVESWQYAMQPNAWTFHRSEGRYEHTDPAELGWVVEVDEHAPVAALRPGGWAAIAQ